MIAAPMGQAPPSGDVKPGRDPSHARPLREGRRSERTCCLVFKDRALLSAASESRLGRKKSLSDGEALKDAPLVAARFSPIRRVEF
jgi:hypothetical protein